MTDPEDTRRDEEMRALLEDTVSDLEPRPGLDDILNRTKVTPMSSKRPWIYGVVGAVAATAATLVAVTVIADDDPREVSGPATTPSATPSQSTSPSPSESTAPSQDPTGDPSTGSGESKAVPVYYVSDTSTGPRLFREFHQLEATPVAALEEAISGTPYDPDYRSDWPAGTSVVEVRVDGGQADDVVWVDLDDTSLRNRPAGMTEAEASMAVEQLIHTTHAMLQQRPPIQFTLAGDRTDMLLGVPVSEPVAAGDPMAVQGTVWVISPQDGDEVGSTFTVEGRGAFFEANVSWQLLEGETVVKEGFATAEEGMTLSPYSFQVEDIAPGDYVLRVYDADMSGGEGNGEAEDTKRVTVGK